MEQDSQFLLTLSELRPSISKLGQSVLHLSEVAERLANEDRTLVSHRNQRPETVAEHSNMLAIIGPVVAEEYYPDLNADLVARYAAVHDVVEAYVGDTPTHDISAKGQHDKALLERAGLEALQRDFAIMPSFVNLVTSYEDQQIPEARFVRVLDKCMPALLAFANNGQELRSKMTKNAVISNSEQRATDLRNAYPEYETLIALREELSLLMAHEFLQ